MNGGLCIQSSSGTVSCFCLNGFSGSRCEISPFVTTTTTTLTTTTARTCASQPCLNSATCVPLQNSFICVCPPNFSGVLCEQVKNNCASNPCQNGGTCLPITQPGVNPPYACVCQPSFTGINCQTFQATTTQSTVRNPCLPNPCNSGGTCFPNGPSFICSCPPTYTGVFCEQRSVELCNVNSCYNGGTCQTRTTNQFDFTVVCLCPVNYTGSRCQTFLTGPKNCECFNNGVCLSDGSCQCLPNFYGKRCEFYLNPTPFGTTTKSPCPSGLCYQGTCMAIPQTGASYCQCFTGWTGPRCNIRNNCDSQCKNGASCFNTINGFVCSCAPGFTGLNCETSTNQVDLSLSCSNFLCLNGGTCYNNFFGKAECQCRRGYIGLNCEQDVCKLPLVYGSCLQSITRFYYNSQLKVCQPFQYTGCRGLLTKIKKSLIFLNH